MFSGRRIKKKKKNARLSIKKGPRTIDTGNPRDDWKFPKAEDHEDLMKTPEDWEEKEK